MDNITHTLIGFGVYRALPEKWRRPEALWASVIGNNIPDSDILERLIPNTDDMNYLIHHRGYTHSVFFAIPLGLLVGAAVNRFRGKAWRDPLALWIGVGSAILHILADTLNNYGVHPFSPFFNRLYYGDSVFIVEPFLWFALIPVAILTVEKRWAKATWTAILATLLTGIWFVPWLGKGFAFFLTSASLALSFAILRTKKTRIGIAAAVLTVAAFLGTGAIVRNEVQAAWRKSGLSDEKLLDIESTPTPGNPLCWRSWIRTENTTHYISRAAGVSLLPALTAPRDCPSAQEEPKKAELSAILLPVTPRVAWYAQSDLEKELHEEVYAKSCRYRRFLNFARLPFLKEISEESETPIWIAGDLRYDRDRELGFSDFVVTLDDECDASTDVWEMPISRASRRE